MALTLEKQCEAAEAAWVLTVRHGWTTWCDGYGSWSATRPRRQGEPAPPNRPHLVWVEAAEPGGLAHQMEEHDK